MYVPNEIPSGVDPKRGFLSVHTPIRQAKVLIVERDVRQRASLIELFGPNVDCEIQCSSDEDDALHVAKTWYPHLITFNPLTSPGGGQRFLRDVRSLPELQSTYVLILSDANMVEQFGRSASGQADDFLAFPCSSVELVSRIKCGLRVRDLQHKLASRNRCLQHFALVDPVTGLLNARALAQVLVAEQNRARHEGKPFSVLIGRVELLDRRRGEVFVGSLRDEVMKAVGLVLVDNVRATDFVAQQTSGEFVLVMPGINRQEVQQASARLTSLVERISVEMPSSRIGVTIHLSDYAVDPQRVR